VEAAAVVRPEAVVVAVVVAVAAGSRFLEQ
jgi:hypothetical protein